MEHKHTIKIEQIISAELLNWMEAFLISGQTTGLSKNTIQFYKEGLQSFMRFCSQIEVGSIYDITAIEIRKYLLHLENKGHNPGGVHAKYRTVRAFLNWFEIEIDDPDWKNPIRKIRVRQSKIPPLEPADIEAVREMLATCNKKTEDPHWRKKLDFMNLRDKLIILMLMDTGLRASELLSLTVDNINPITGVVQIVHGKGGKPRVVFIGRKTRQALRKYLKNVDIQDYLFIGILGVRMTRNGLHQILTRRAKWAGVKPQSPHSFRRLFAITMLRNGVDIFSLQLLMGHSDIQILRRYLKQTNQDTMKAHIKGSSVDRQIH